MHFFSKVYCASTILCLCTAMRTAVVYSAVHLSFVYVEFAALTSEGRRICVKVLSGCLDHADHLRFHAKLLKTVLFDALIAGPVDVMGKTGRHRSSCRVGLSLPIGQHDLYYIVYYNTKLFAYV